MTNRVILIVEDEAIVALDLRTRISQLGYSPIVALSSTEALKLVSQNPPDLAILDISLQDDVDGIELAIQLQEKLGIPIFYISALIDENTKKRADETNPIAYIEKPFTDEDLQSALSKAFE